MGDDLINWGLQQRQLLVDAASEAINISLQQREQLFAFQSKTLRQTAGLGDSAYRYKVVEVSDAWNTLMVIRVPLLEGEVATEKDTSTSASEHTGAARERVFDTFDEATMYVNSQRGVDCGRSD